MASGAENVPGLKHTTEIAGLFLAFMPKISGRRAFATCCEAAAARRREALRRENVGMSNHNPNEKLRPRKSKVSVALAINHGLGDPKLIPKGADEG